MWQAISRPISIPHGRRRPDRLRVEAIDGPIGKIEKATKPIDTGYIVVDTGPWIFGKKVLLPGEVINSVDADHRTVHVNRTKDEIKSAPDASSYFSHPGISWGDW